MPSLRRSHGARGGPLAEAMEHPLARSLRVDCADSSVTFLREGSGWALPKYHQLCMNEGPVARQWLGGFPRKCRIAKQEGVKFTLHARGFMIKRAHFATWFAWSPCSHPSAPKVLRYAKTGTRRIRFPGRLLSSTFPSVSLCHPRRAGALLLRLGGNARHTFNAATISTPTQAAMPHIHEYRNRSRAEVDTVFPYGTDTNAL